MSAPSEKNPPRVVRLVAYVLDESCPPIARQRRWMRANGGKYEGGEWMEPEDEAEFFDGDARLDKVVKRLGRAEQLLAKWSMKAPFMPDEVVAFLKESKELL